MAIAVLDACVLYPAPLRDLLMHLAVFDLFQPRWTAEIHEEWIEALLVSRPDLNRRQLNRTRDLMNANVRGDCLVTGYEPLIDTLSLPDANDRHVLAAAIHSASTHIVMFNLSDFPPPATQPYGITAIHPDEFTLALLQRDADGFCQAVARLRSTLKNPAKSVAELLTTFNSQRLHKTVQTLQPFLGVL